MIIKEHKTYSYSLAIEEYTAITTTIEVIKDLISMLDRNVVCTSNSEIYLNSALFVLNSLLDNNRKEIYINKV